MTEKTKAVNLTEDEIIHLIGQAGCKLSYPAANIENTIERMNYLNKRLKSFKEPEVEVQSKPENASGWGASQNEEVK